MKSYAIIGLGRFGSRIARQLTALGEDVLAIDRREAQVALVAEQVARAAVADGKNKEALQKLGVQDCDCAILAIGSDLGTSVLITMNLKALGIPKIICKAQDEIHREILEKLGADQVIIPENMVADKLAASLSSSDILDYIELSDDYGVIECKPPQPWVGKTICALRVRTEYGVNIIAVRRDDDVAISPSPDERIEKEDVLVMLGDYESLKKIEKL